MGEGHEGWAEGLFGEVSWVVRGVEKEDAAPLGDDPACREAVLDDEGRL